MTTACDGRDPLDFEQLADPLVGPLLIALKNCLCEALTRTMSGPVCRCYIAWDQGIPVMDGCMCECADNAGRKGVGDGWVRLVSVDRNLGQGLGIGAGGSPYGWDSQACPLGWIATVELGAARCHPVPEGDELPGEQEITDLSLYRLSDYRAMREAVKCCPYLNDERKPRPHLAGSFTPLGASGGCSGGAMTVQVELSEVDRCKE